MLWISLTKDIVNVKNLHELETREVSERQLQMNEPLQNKEISLAENVWKLEECWGKI